MKTRPPLTPESAIRRALAGGGQDMQALIATGHKRTTLLFALKFMKDDGELTTHRVNGRAPILYRLTRAGKARRRQDEKYLKEGRG